MKCIVGLGNPGKKYAKTRHNIGFMFLDYLALNFKIPFVPGKGDYYVIETRLLGQDILFVKPVTYMNLSGEAVRQIVDNFSLEMDELLVVYDDFSLPFGRIRFRKKGSDGGHNGIKSIIYNMASEDIPRLRFGIGAGFENAIDFVLDDFSPSEIKQLNQIFSVAQQGIEKWIIEGIDSAMNAYNGNILN